MTENSHIRKALSIAILVISIALLAGSGFRSHKVFEPAEDDFGMFIFHRVSEQDMVIDSTFSGVVRVNGKLVTTYDRLSDTGAKRACPT